MSSRQSRYGLLTVGTGNGCYVSGEFSALQGKVWGQRSFRVERQAHVLALGGFLLRAHRWLSMEASVFTPRDPPMEMRGTSWVNLLLIKYSGWGTFPAVVGQKCFSEYVIRKIQFLCLKNIYHLWNHRNGRVCDETGTPGSSQTEGSFVEFSLGDFSRLLPGWPAPGKSSKVWDSSGKTGSSQQTGSLSTPFTAARMLSQLKVPTYFGNQVWDERTQLT